MKRIIKGGTLKTDTNLTVISESVSRVDFPPTCESVSVSHLEYTIRSIMRAS